jgi:transcriptional regulator with XRE-family HTH domain
MTKRPQPTERSRLAGLRIKKMRQARGWSVQRVADAMNNNGHPIQRTTVAKIEIDNGENQRHMTVDELCAFAAVFGVSIEQICGGAPLCMTCKDDPPEGFRCLACGSEGS